jgi:hypothetical protein
MVLAALVPWAAAAQSGPGEETDLATIVTGESDPGRCLSAVFIREIDGEEFTTRTQDFQLPSGWHSMNGMAVIDTRECPVAIGGERLPVPDLEHDFEAGVTYYVGLDHSSANHNDWRLVIWQAEKAGLGTTGTGSTDEH